MENLVLKMNELTTESISSIDPFQSLQEAHKDDDFRVRTIGFVCVCEFNAKIKAQEIFNLVLPVVDIVRYNGLSGNLSGGTRVGDKTHRINKKHAKVTKEKGIKAPQMRNALQMWYTLSQDPNVNIYTQIFFPKTNSVSIQVSGCRSLLHVDNVASFLSKTLKGNINGIRLTLCSSQFKASYKKLNMEQLFSKLQQMQNTNKMFGDEPLMWLGSWKDFNVDANVHFQVMNTQSQKMYRVTVYKGGTCSLQCTNASDIEKMINATKLLCQASTLC